MSGERAFRWLRILFLVAVLFLAPHGGSALAGMTDYCQVPPYVIQNIPPNVLILLDISRSMLYFSYYDGYQTPDNVLDDNQCGNQAAPCMGYNWSGRPLSHRYYGYFDPGKYYAYSNGVFNATNNVTATSTKAVNEWTGDFLNWLSMRRIDVMRKVLTGGRPNGSRIDGEIADADDIGVFRRVTQAEALANTPFTTTGNRDVLFVFATGNSGTSRFETYATQNTDTTNNISGLTNITNQVANQSIAVNVTVPLPMEGVLQQTVGARARVGLMFYSTGDGGKVVTDVGKDVAGHSSLNDTINQINLSRPNTFTPLAEALWSATGYFAQQASISGYTTPSGSGPRYGNSDYGTSNNSDPMNFGTGGTPRWPVCQRSFVLLLTDGEPCDDGNIPTSLLNYTSGKSIFNCTGDSCPPLDNGALYSFPASSLNSPSCISGATSGVEDAALFMHTTDLRNNPTVGPNDISGFQNLSLYTVFAFGRNSTLLKYTAINGGFENSGSSERPSTGSPSNWDKNGDGVPDTYFQATEGAELEQAVRDAFSGILKRASSGTAASVLASGEGSGANLIQAVFYPRRSVGNDIISWTGSLQNMWYFVDPFFANATIREDTDNDAVLHLVDDRIVQFFFDPVSQLTQVKRWHSDNNGLQTTQDTTLSFENIHSLWEAGKKLWQRNLSTLPRTIYTTLNGSTLIPFSVGNATLNDALLPDTGDDVTTIINYVRGIDNTDDLNLRPRTVTFGSDNNVWKLGDVVNSTPRIVASVPLNKYDTVYNDTTYKSFIDNTNYKNRGMVFTGGNDGMLHAFRLGKLELSWTGKPRVEKARITNPENPGDLSPLGDEAWAFIPKNALPYLKYLKDPDYCHLYYTDLAPYVFDASIGSGSGDQSTQPRTPASWRTVLIGGMRTGGACANTCTAGSNCVKTPATDQGFSSYFALDVTNPMVPLLLWEFTSPDRDLGFTTTGPAVVRVNGLNGSTRDQSLNGEWYVVFGSGPTGPIDNTNNQFLGRSNQPLKFFVVNLKTGALAQTIDTGIAEAFAGSMINSVADFTSLNNQVDYQDDAIYVGYVKNAGSVPSNTWTNGGVGRILTANTTPIGSGSSGTWKWSQVIDGIGPVTSAVARLQNTNLGTNWLFFGAGRYFFENPPTGTNTAPEIDDATGQRSLFGIKDPCFVNGTISDPTSCASIPPVVFPGQLTNATVNTVPLTEGSRGWYITLEGSSTIGTTSTYFTYDNVTQPFRAERVITDPLATTSGVVFFTTYKPYADECALGGKSFLWAVRYNTGDAPSYAVMKGKALVQVSTASVEQIDLSKAFKTEYGGGMGGRRTGAIEGVPPTAQGLSLLSPPPPVKRIMHMMER
jgi:type IV pilus assembly protein PilY1